jgi:hypothetical protein
LSAAASVAIGSSLRIVSVVWETDPRPVGVVGPDEGAKSETCSVLGTVSVP